MWHGQRKILLNSRYAYLEQKENEKMKDVMILTCAGQIGMAIACRMGYGMKIVIGDKSKKMLRTSLK